MASKHHSVRHETMAICPNPIFVIGSPRSGTTGLCQALGTHSDLCALDETQFLWDLFGAGILDKNYRRGGPQGSWLQEQGIPLEAFIEYAGIGFNAMLTKLSNGVRWIDQTPIYALMAEHLADMFPGAKFIHICRDGRTTVESMINYLNRYPDGTKPNIPWASNFREACRTWRQYVSASLNLAEARPARCLMARYESLVGDPELVFDEIFRFLDLEPQPGAAEFLRTTRVNSSFGDQVHPSRAPSDGDAVWSAWSPERQQVFTDEIGDFLDQCGYGSCGHS